MLLAPKLPPGLFSNGTVYQSKGRWYDASLVRFFADTIRPVEPWRELTADSDAETAITLDGVPRAILGWRGNDGAGSLGIGTNTKLYIHWLGHLYDITPSGFTAGTVDATVGSGGDSWGDGLWGAGLWGGSDATQTTLFPPACWQLDTFGDYLVGCSSPNDGNLYYWDRVAVDIAVPMTGAPTACVGVVVTPERFVVALAPGFAVRTVQWASQESLTDWSGLGATATVVLTSDAVIPADGDTVTVGSQTYTFKTALTPTAGQVLINGSAANALINLKRAVTLTGTPGTDYAAATPSNTSVTATTLTATTLVFEALTIGAAGNSLPSTEVSAHLSFPTTTLTGGVDMGTAGDFVLEGKGSLVRGVRAKGETLLFTTADLWAMRYIGGTLVYGFERVGGDCGLIAPGAVTTVDTQAIWMAPSGFFRYDGFVHPIKCDVADRVFTDLNTTQQGKVVCYPVTQYGEVTWHYPSAASNENDRYATYNYREDHWVTGALSRTCGADAGPVAFTVLGAANGKLYQHGVGGSRLDIDGETELLPWVESGPFELGDGEHIMYVEGLFPDDKTYGKVAYTLYGAMDPTSVETTNGPYTLDAELNTRFTARQMRLRLDTVLGALDWRGNIPRFLAKPAGTRGSRRRITELPSSDVLVPAASLWRGTVADGADIADGRTVAL